jgi:hypothetical protein
MSIACLTVTFKTVYIRTVFKVLASEENTTVFCYHLLVVLSSVLYDSNECRMELLQNA